MKREIALWGTGEIAKKFCFRYRDVFDIAVVFDNNEKKHGTYLYGIPVKKWTPSNQYKIIIATQYWREIAEQLDVQCLLPFKDYLPYNYVDGNEKIAYKELYDLKKICRQRIDYTNLLPDKKIAVVYGNCQTDLIVDLLRLNKAFSEEYAVISIPTVCLYNDAPQFVGDFIKDDAFWKRIDLFIYQHVDEKNRFWSELCTDNLLNKLKADCKKVRIVNIYFSGYFPQMIRNKNNALTDVHQSGILPFGDKYADALMEKQMKPEAIIEHLSREDFLSGKTIDENVQNSFRELQAREEQADVKISDYLEEHYREEQLFFSPNHPNGHVLSEYVERILRFMEGAKIFGGGNACSEHNIRKLDFALLCGTLKGQDIPLYPSVIRHLGLRNYEKRYYPNRYIYPELLLDFEEYLGLYINVAYTRRNTNDTV